MITDKGERGRRRERGSWNSQRGEQWWLGELAAWAGWDRGRAGLRAR